MITSLNLTATDTAELAADAAMYDLTAALECYSKLCWADGDSAPTARPERQWLEAMHAELREAQRFLLELAAATEA